VECVEKFAKILTASSKSEVCIENQSNSSEIPHKINSPQEIKQIFCISFKSEGFELLLPCLPKSEDGLFLQIQSLSFQSAPSSDLLDSNNTITTGENSKKNLVAVFRDNISFSVDIHLLQNSVKTSIFQVMVVSECIREVGNVSDSIKPETTLKVALQTCTVILRVQDIQVIALIAAKQIELIHKLFARNTDPVNSFNKRETLSERKNTHSSSSCLDLDLSMEELSIVLQGAGPEDTKTTLGSEPIPFDECAELSIVLSKFKFTYVTRSGISCSSQSANLLLNHVAVKFGSAKKCPIAGKKHCFPNVLVSAF
jgi:hypothetical protein